MILSACRFETERLLVDEWRSLSSSDWQRQELAPLVADLMTGPVTRSLPATWQGPYTVERARGWIDERNAEGATLLAIEKSTRQPIGLLILFEAPGDESEAGTDVRLGYLLSEKSWGKGFGSEFVAGFVDWCRRESSISSITGGVAPENPASSRVLLKNGFQLFGTSDEPAGGEQLYRLHLHRGQRSD